jgi:hypothetical protein
MIYCNKNKAELKKKKEQIQRILYFYLVGIKHFLLKLFKLYFINIQLHQLFIFIYRYITRLYQIIQRQFFFFLNVLDQHFFRPRFCIILLNYEIK